MARKRVVDPAVQGKLDELAAVLLDGDAPDWSALDAFELGALVAVLGAVDGGVMIRSSERGQSRSVGVFVGGQSQWTTCRDQREALALLNAVVTTLESLAGSRVSPAPTGKATRSRKAAAGA